jgi:tRNA(fMet)-specific endonuclease VapC
MRGRLAKINHQKSDSTVAYDLLRTTVDYFCGLTILPFDSDAGEKFHQLRSQKIRIGTLDLRIAAIVLQQNGILLTRNQRHFAQVPGLKLEDWSQ